MNGKLEVLAPDACFVVEFGEERMLRGNSGGSTLIPAWNPAPLVLQSGPDTPTAPQRTGAGKKEVVSVP